ncbi:MAG: hypothetical protein ACRCY3_08400 [Sphingorhabdus sp.]
MKKMKFARIMCAASTIAFASMVSAQSSETVPAAEAAPAMVETAPAPIEVKPLENLMLNSGMPITLAVTEEVNSSTHEEGDIFKLTVINDVKIGDKVVIPRGTPANGEITWRTGKGAFGKSGKLEFALTNIDLNGKKIPVIGNFRQEGEGNTVATGVGIIAVGVFAGFITGKRARLPAGRELMSQLAQDVPFAPNGQLASSFDSDAAMKAAEEKTEIGKCKIAARSMPAKKQEKALEECYTKRME